jgi:hypothetical protein
MEEYGILMSIQRYKLWLLHKGSDRTRSSGMCQPASIISSVTNSVADMTDDISNMQIDDGVTVGSNRGHSALARQAEAKHSHTD